jgi:hypothetical protein
VSVTLLRFVTLRQGRRNWGGQEGEGQPPPLPFTRRGTGGQRCPFNVKDCLGEMTEILVQ